MDIIYQLPFPEFICSKIFSFACKSPHTDLGSAIIKKIIRFPYIYNKFVEKGGIVLDGDGNVVKILMNIPQGDIKPEKDVLTNYERKKQMTFDIAPLSSLPNLTHLDLHFTRVIGDIVHLKSLPNLKRLQLSNTLVYGDIAHLNSVSKLTQINLMYTRVSGHISHLTYLPNLDTLIVRYTSVEGKASDFRKYRKIAGLKKCHIDLNWL